MKPKILDLIDFEKVNTLLEGFNKSTGFVTAILDLNGNIICKSGWRQICTEFHRVNPETSRRCTVSDTVLAGKLVEGEGYHFYKCLNGLVDVAVPIVIKGEHIANLFSGQFFFEEPDSSFFRKQAENYGFNERIYLQALKNVPVISKEKVKLAMDFLLDMTQLISELSLQKLEQTELNQALKISEEHHRSILHTAMDGFWLTDMQGHLLEVNETYCRMSGYNEKELLNMNITDLEIKETKTKTLAHFQQLKKIGKDRFESTHRHKNGTVFQVEIAAQYRKNGEGQYMVFLKDITESKITEEKIKESQAKLSEALEVSNRSRQSLLSVLEDQRQTQQQIKKLNAELEHRVVERTVQLENANKELEAFSYSVSHDLRAPLRGIDGFSLALYEDYEEKLDDTAKDYIARIRTATTKMDGLIDSLLKLSRISRLEMNFEEVNLSKIVHKIINELKDSDESRIAEFIIQENVTVIGDVNLLKIVFENLLNNAWKFTSKKDKTIIEFGVLTENSKATYFVKDNGIGFDINCSVHFNVCIQKKNIPVQV